MTGDGEQEIEPRDIAMKEKKGWDRWKRSGREIEKKDSSSENE